MKTLMPHTQPHACKFRRTVIAVAWGMILCPPPGCADEPKDFLTLYSTQCRQENPQFKGFDADRGAVFFRSRQGNEWSCSTCHTEDPRSKGEHCETRKSIQPLAPSANAERFTDPLKVEKWFKRSCKDVLGRECTAQEKGDVLSYLLSVH